MEIQDNNNNNQNNLNNQQNQFQKIEITKNTTNAPPNTNSDVAPPIKLISPFEKMRSENYLIMGRYRLLKKLGSGSFGEIYDGIDVHTEEKIAIKFEPLNSRYPQLQYESRVYKVLKKEELEFRI